MDILIYTIYLKSYILYIDKLASGTMAARATPNENRKKTPLGIVIITILTVISGLILLTMSFFTFIVLVHLGPVGLIRSRLFICTWHCFNHCFNWIVQGKGMVMDITFNIVRIWSGRLFTKYYKRTAIFDCRACYKYNNNILFVQTKC